MEIRSNTTFLPVLHKPEHRNGRGYLNLSYLTSELNGNDETKLVLWDNIIRGDIDEHGKTSNSSSDNWVGLTGFTIIYVAPVTLDNKEMEPGKLQYSQKHMDRGNQY